MSQLALEKYGFTRELILSGESLDFTPEKPKLVGEKREFYLKEVVDAVTKAVMDDLRHEMEYTDELLTEINYRDEQIEQLQLQVQQLTANIRKAEGFSTQMSNVEKMMDALETSVNDFNIQHQKDVQRIQELQSSLHQREAETADIRRRLTESDTSLSELRVRVSDLELDLDRRDAQISEFDERFRRQEQDINEVLDILRSELEARGISVD